MVALSLKICVRQCNLVKTMQFEPSTAVYDTCRIIRERVPEAQTGQASDYGLFLSDEDPRKGIWLESGRTLDYYMLRNGDILDYKKKQRPLKIKMLDGAVKTIMVDDSKTVGELLVTICSRIGITNYEEYSLIQEVMEEKKEDGTGTLKKDRTLLRDERKMEKLKAKLHTDDDLNWLDHSRTFREQGVEETETLLLRRKFFYSDQNVDSRDPVQLNLLYVQARDDILNGSHPVSFDKACEFAGIQAQIQFGPHIEHKHKPGFLDLKEFLPKEYIKQRGNEKKIFQDHKNCGEMTEIEAKVKYVKLARSLRTYGVSFFLVKEKMKSKNKLVPRLLGITKESVMRVEEKTKDVVQEWPLTTVKRWAASPKSFTLDFGEYQESYYSVQTTEGEQISQLIAGYIDIILKKKQSKDRFGLEGDEESTMLEESVSPKKSTILQQQFNRVGRVEHGSVALPGVIRSGSIGTESLSMGTMPSAQQQVIMGQMHRGHMPPLSSAQQALMGTINTSMQAVQQAQADLGEVDNLPPLGQDMASKVWIQNKVDESKHEIHSQVDAITAGTASVVNLTAGDPTDTDYTAVGCAITTISSNLTEMSKGVKLLAALIEDDTGGSNDLMGAARNLAGAVSDLLKAVEPASGEVRQGWWRQITCLNSGPGEPRVFTGFCIFIASYLVGVSDPNSQAGHQGLVDAIQFARANQAIQMACQNLVDPDSSPSQVLSSATIVAKHTSALCNACRLASSKTANPTAKRHFVQSAKEVANSTANLVKTIKALDGDFSQENRNTCLVATAPLIEAVENLTAFASNPEFASVPAQISNEGSAAQEPILQSARAMLDSSTHLLKTARSLVINPKDPPTWSVLAGHSRTVSDSIKGLITAIRDKAPGQRECDYSIDNINRCIRNIEQASLAAVSQNLASRDDISLEALQEQLTSTVQEIGYLIDPISTAARGEAAQLGHKVTQLAGYYEPLIRASVGVASKLQVHQQQMAFLDQTKTLAESALQMIYAAKEGGGNPKASHTHDAIAEAAQLMREAVDDIMVTLNEAASEGGMVGAMVDSIAEAMGRLDEGTSPEPEGSFVDYQTTMVKYSKAIAVTAQEMMTKSVTCPEELGGLASRVTTDYSQLALQGRLAAHTAEPQEIGFQIKAGVQELGHGCIFLVQKAGALQITPSDSYTKRELIECARTVTEKVSMVLSALQAGNKGTQACITAASAVSGIIADLDTTIMFASAGTLNAENDESFADHRENILKTAKALVEDTKMLVSGAASSQDRLAQAAQSSAKTITQLTDVVKLGAASIGSDDPETQVVLINAVKDVAKALAELIGATKCAAGKAADDPSMYQLKSAAKVMVTNVTSLLKTVKAVEDEATRGTRALEATIECIKQELTVFQSKDVPEKSTTPEEFIRMTKGITTATAKAVAAGNSARQEDVISTANLSRKAIFDMLTTCKQAAYHQEVNKDVRSRALLYGTECTTGYIDLLEHVLLVLQGPTAEQKQQLVFYSKRVAGAVTELIQTAEAMKGTEWVDPEDPTVIAETELLGAAASIEAAAKKLEQLKPRAKPKQADETLDFEEQILEAAKSIAAATSALVKSASAAQRELVAQGKVGSIPANAVDDGQWSQGLISAARMVAAATSNLCEAANASVQGQASEEKLISSAKQVAASTAQLLVACKVKADQDSEAMRRLQAAGNAVKRASDNLVRAAQKAAFHKADDDNVVVKTKFVGGIAQVRLQGSGRLHSDM
eukprot:XP_013982757.1 PREDICTED: talin-2-like [Salmo salar]